MVRKSNTKKPSKRSSKTSEESLVFNCTSCSEPQLLVQGKRNILCHPHLQVGVCRECIIFAHAAPVPVDDEGYEVYCRWCCELGNLIYCDKCKAPFCEECIVRNIGAEYYDSLSENEEWNCFICDPVPIMAVRKLTKDVLNHQNFGDPSAHLIENCTAVFAGYADITDSELEEVIKERLRLRRNNYNETLKSLAKSKSKNESDSDEEDGSKGEEGKSDSGESGKLSDDGNSSNNNNNNNNSPSEDGSSPKIESPEKAFRRGSDLDKSKSERKTKKGKSSADEEVMSEQSVEDTEDKLTENSDSNMERDSSNGTNSASSKSTPKKHYRENNTTSDSEDQEKRATAKTKPQKKRKRRTKIR